MGNKFVMSLIFFVTALSMDAQNINITEPEFVGQAILINIDEKPEVLESSRLQVDSDLKLFSFKTNYKFWLEIQGCCSKTILNKSNTPIKFIVKAENNNQDPTALYQIVKLEKDKTKRKLLVSTMSLKGAKTNQESFINFYGKKFGSTSYLLSASIAEPGEYGLVLGSIMEAQARSQMGSPSTIFTFSVK
jgi:hypothetical protein